jgi:hypothetical protein
MQRHITRGNVLTNQPVPISQPNVRESPTINNNFFNYLTQY